jgi:predicted nucleotidyltransferase
MKICSRCHLLALALAALDLLGVGFMKTHFQKYRDGKTLNYKLKSYYNNTLKLRNLREKKKTMRQDFHRVHFYWAVLYCFKTLATAHRQVK